MDERSQIGEVPTQQASYAVAENDKTCLPDQRSRVDCCEKYNIRVWTWTDFDDCIMTHTAETLAGNCLFLDEIPS